MNTSQWDKQVDVLVVGSGNGAMTAALCAWEMGTKDVLLIEKAAQFGGTSAMSGGGIWVPCNRYAKAAGAVDSLEDAKQYLMATIPSDQVPERLIDAYLQNAHQMVDFLYERAQIRYQTLEKYPDYFTDKPGAREGHRSLEPEPIDMRKLKGAERQLMENACYMFDRVSLTQVEAQRMLTAKISEWITLGGKLILGHYFDLPWVLTHKQSRRATEGIAGIAKLFLALHKRHIPMWRHAALKELVVEAGRVVGAVVESDARSLRIAANKGVILAAGGFEQNQQMREQYLPKPTSTHWSAGIKTNTGDVIQAGLAIGAKVALMGNAWWCTTLCIPGREYPWLQIAIKSLPGSITVNRLGKRFGNESQNYMSFLRETYRKHTDEEPCIPAYMIFDHKFKKRYPAYPLMMPNVFMPKRFLDEGFAAYDHSIEGLANKMGIDPQGLRQTIERFNQYAREGKDPDFARGDVAYDRYYGDHRVGPNPCLGPLEEPPYYAIELQPGDIGTQGGLVINEHAQVLDQHDEAIEGLYACGNTTAAVLPTYPGPGATLGPAMTFGFLAARHLSQLSN